MTSFLLEADQIPTLDSEKLLFNTTFIICLVVHLLMIKFRADEEKHNIIN